MEGVGAIVSLKFRTVKFTPFFLGASVSFVFIAVHRSQIDTNARLRKANRPTRANTVSFFLALM